MIASWEKAKNLFSILLDRILYIHIAVRFSFWYLSSQEGPGNAEAVVVMAPGLMGWHWLAGFYLAFWVFFGKMCYICVWFPVTSVLEISLKKKKCSPNPNKSTQSGGRGVQIPQNSWAAGLHKNVDKWNTLGAFSTSAFIWTTLA